MTVASYTPIASLKADIWYLNPLLAQAAGSWQHAIINPLKEDHDTGSLGVPITFREKQLKM